MPIYTLTEPQIAQFKKQGYLLLPNAIPQKLLELWQNIASKLERNTLAEYKTGVKQQNWCVIEDPVGPRLMRYNDILKISPGACLDLLATPAIMAIAKQLCGIGAIPLQMDLLYKQQHPHPIVNWHQDAQYTRNYPYLNIGIYLDDASSGDGCLRYVPGTQHQLQDIQGLSELHGWEIPGSIEQAAQAGDILIQDMMILHGSEPKRSQGVRRTIYVEYRPLAAIEESQAQSAQWLEYRKQWMGLILARIATDELPESWKSYYPTGQLDQDEIVRQIIENKEPPIPGVWATHTVHHPDYPIPEDLRE